jgi:hypothetical protein
VTAARGDVGGFGHDGEHPQRDEHVDRVEAGDQLAVPVRAIDERGDDLDRGAAELLAHVGGAGVAAERLDQAGLAALEATSARPSARRSRAA